MKNNNKNNNNNNTMMIMKRESAKTRDNYLFFSFFQAAQTERTRIRSRRRRRPKQQQHIHQQHPRQLAGPLLAGGFGGREKGAKPRDFILLTIFLALTLVAAAAPTATTTTTLAVVVVTTTPTTVGRGSLQQEAVPLSSSTGTTTATLISTNPPLAVVGHEPEPTTEAIAAAAAASLTDSAQVDVVDVGGGGVVGSVSDNSTTKTTRMSKERRPSVLVSLGTQEAEQMSDKAPAKELRQQGQQGPLDTTHTFGTNNAHNDNNKLTSQLEALARPPSPLSRSNVEQVGLNEKPTRSLDRNTTSAAGNTTTFPTRATRHHFACNTSASSNDDDDDDDEDEVDQSPSSSFLPFNCRTMTKMTTTTTNPSSGSHILTLPERERAALEEESTNGASRNNQLERSTTDDTSKTDQPPPPPPTPEAAATATNTTAGPTSNSPAVSAEPDHSIRGNGGSSNDTNTSTNTTTDTTTATNSEMIVVSSLAQELDAPISASEIVSGGSWAKNSPSEQSRNADSSSSASSYSTTHQLEDELNNKTTTKIGARDCSKLYHEWDLLGIGAFFGLAEPCSASRSSTKSLDFDNNFNNQSKENSAGSSVEFDSSSSSRSEDDQQQQHKSSQLRNHIRFAVWMCLLIFFAASLALFGYKLTVCSLEKHRMNSARGDGGSMMEPSNAGCSTDNCAYLNQAHLYQQQQQQAQAQSMSLDNSGAGSDRRQTLSILIESMLLRDPATRQQSNQQQQQPLAHCSCLFPPDNRQLALTSHRLRTLWGLCPSTASTAAASRQRGRRSGNNSSLMRQHSRMSPSRRHVRPLEANHCAAAAAAANLYHQQMAATANCSNTSRDASQSEAAELNVCLNSSSPLFQPPPAYQHQHPTSVATSAAAGGCVCTGATLHQYSERLDDNHFAHHPPDHAHLLSDVAASACRSNRPPAYSEIFATTTAAITQPPQSSSPMCCSALSSTNYHLPPAQVPTNTNNNMITHSSSSSTSSQGEINSSSNSRADSMGTPSSGGAAASAVTTGTETTTTLSTAVIETPTNTPDTNVDVAAGQQRQLEDTSAEAVVAAAAGITGGSGERNLLVKLNLNKTKLLSASDLMLLSKLIDVPIVVQQQQQQHQQQEEELPDRVEEDL